MIQNEIGTKKCNTQNPKNETNENYGLFYIFFFFFFFGCSIKTLKVSKLSYIENIERCNTNNGVANNAHTFKYTNTHTFIDYENINTPAIGLSNS